VAIYGGVMLSVVYHFVELQLASLMIILQLLEEQFLGMILQIFNLIDKNLKVTFKENKAIDAGGAVLKQQ